MSIIGVQKISFCDRLKPSFVTITGIPHKHFHEMNKLVLDYPLHCFESIHTFPTRYDDALVLIFKRLKSRVDDKTISNRRLPDAAPSG